MHSTEEIERRVLDLQNGSYTSSMKLVVSRTGIISHVYLQHISDIFQVIHL